MPPTEEDRRVFETMTKENHGKEIRNLIGLIVVSVAAGVGLRLLFDFLSR